MRVFGVRFGWTVGGAIAGWALIGGCAGGSGGDEDPFASTLGGSGSDTGPGPGLESGGLETGSEGSSGTPVGDDEGGDSGPSTTGNPVNPNCGDGQLDPGELCDDGNDVDTDECTSLCAWPTCQDGIVSGDETGVDCGGTVCNPCGVDAACAAHTDCGTLVCTSNVCRYPTTCLDMLQINPEAGSGAYWIDPDGTAGAGEPFVAFCDMHTQGGGWTVLHASNGADGVTPMVSINPVYGNPLQFDHYSLSGAQKVAIAQLSTQTVFRQPGQIWLTINHAPFSNLLLVPQSEEHYSVTIAANDGTAVAGFMSWSNFNITHGGDFALTTTAAETCHGPAVQGHDHHNPAYWHLNCGCQLSYLYSHSAAVADGDAAYRINTPLGPWAAPAVVCDGAEANSLVFYMGTR